MAMRLATFLWTVLIFQNVNAAVPHTFMAGDPARASEVNANFTSLDTAIQANATAIEESSEINQFFDRSRLYPNWRYDPEFFIASPTLGGNWAVRLNDNFSESVTTEPTINISSAYDGGSERFVAWYGIDVLWRPRSSANIATSELSTEQKELYSFGLSHTRGRLAGARTFSTVTYSQDGIIPEYRFTVEGEVVDLPWQVYATRETVLEAVRAISGHFNFGGTTTMVCTRINLHLTADGNIDIESECEAFEQPS